MGSFEYISIIALTCYTFLFLIFMTAKKNKLINSYLLVICASMAWTGGSFFMRIQLWPSYVFWYNVSICGLLYLAYALFAFIYACAREKKQTVCRVWFFLMTAAAIINIPSGFFLKCPNIVIGANNQAVFEYDITWTVGLLFALVAGIVLHAVLIIVKNCRNNALFAKQIEPTIIGYILLFFSNLALVFPIFAGFPIDILGGLLNAGLMFYALVIRHVFRLKMLTSEAVCYGAALLTTLPLFYRMNPYITAFLHKNIPQFGDDYSLISATLFLVIALAFVFLWRRILGAIFVKEDQMKQECIQKFSLAVSKSLRIKDIYKEIVDAIKTATDIEAVYICMQSGKNQPFKTVYTDSPLADNSYSLTYDNPIVTYLQKQDECLFMKEFRYSVEYKAMWKEEKTMLNDFSIEFAIALKDHEELIGILLFSNKSGKATIDYNDSNFLTSISSIASIAIKNSMLYEQAYKEAITDELTGLYNRKYFNQYLEESFEKYKKSSLVLILINIDDFKLYNQLYGITAGDKALQKIAKILMASVGDNGCVARYGGKEFAILLPQYDISEARILAEGMRKQIYNLDTVRGDYAMKRLTISAGIDAYPYGASTSKELMDNVDLSVYNVKRNGKNAIRVFDTVIAGDKTDGDSNSPQSIYQGYESTIYALTAAIDTKDHYTFRHSNNVAYYATSLGKALGMNSDIIEIIRQSALLHDIGKIGIPESVLNKQGRLAADEYDIIKGHVEASIGIIKHLPSLDYVIPAITGHHERYDGHGYPRGIVGKDIPTTARILGIADSFDAIVSKRCYKNAIPLEEAIHILEAEAGKQFDPEMVVVFIALLKSGEVKVAADEALL